MHFIQLAFNYLVLSKFFHSYEVWESDVIKNVIPITSNVVPSVYLIFS